MKPKERLINYALLSANNKPTCEPSNESPYSSHNNNHFNHKEITDIPIDLSLKKQQQQLPSSSSPPSTTTNDYGIFSSSNIHLKQQHNNHNNHNNHNESPPYERTAFPLPPISPPLSRSSHQINGDWPGGGDGGGPGGGGNGSRFHCLSSLMAAKHAAAAAYAAAYHHHHPHPHPGQIFPYLFINPGCLTSGPPPPLATHPTTPDIVVGENGKKLIDSTTNTILDHYVMPPYRLHQDGILFPFHQAHHLNELPFNHHHQHHHHNDSNRNGTSNHHHNEDQNPPLSAESSTSSSSSSSSSSPYEYHLTEYQQNRGTKTNHQLSSPSSLSSPPVVSNHHNNHLNNHNNHQSKLNGSHQQVLVASCYDPKVTKLKRAASLPSLLLPTIKYNQMNGIIKQNGLFKHHHQNNNKLISIRRSKSECNLHLIKCYSSSSSRVTSTNNNNNNNVTIAAASTSNMANNTITTIASTTTTNTTKICAPKKLFASNYYQQNILKETKESRRLSIENKELSNNPNRNQQPQQTTNNETKFYRNYRKEVIECWDNERRNENDRMNNGKSYKDTSDLNILDLRTNNNGNNMPVLKTTHNNNNNNNNNNKVVMPEGNLKLSPTTTTKDDKIPIIKFPSLESVPGCGGGGSGGASGQPNSPIAHPLDLYKQYYYYLMQEPAFASRAAVAVAETYAKLLNSNHNTNSNNNSPPDDGKSSNENLINNNGNNQSHHNNHIQKSMINPNGDSKSFENNSLYETKRTSPDCSQDGLRTELRSADTTNGNIMFDRKRISRPLTGKHVRHGTGASPSTLVSLRNMIQQRQKLKEIGKFDCNIRYGKGKSNKRIKRK